MPGTVSGHPAASTALRAMLAACSPTCITQPSTTSSTTAGSRSLRSRTALSSSAARSTGCHSRSLPLRLPSGVLTASTITAVRTLQSLLPRRAASVTGTFGLGSPAARPRLPSSPSPLRFDARPPGFEHTRQVGSFGRYRRVQRARLGSMRRSTIDEVNARAAGVTVPRRFLELAAARPDAPMLHARGDDGWTVWTAADVRENGGAAAQGLLVDRVAARRTGAADDAQPSRLPLARSRGPVHPRHAREHLQLVVARGDPVPGERLRRRGSRSSRTPATSTASSRCATSCRNSSGST